MKTRARGRSRASTPPRRPGLRWLAEPGALRTPARAGGGRGLPGARVDRAGRRCARDGRGGARARARAARTCAGARAASARRRALAATTRLRLAAAAQRAGAGLAELLRRAPPAARSRAIARERGALSRAGARAVERVCERIERAVRARPSRPSRLHGDLWGGNVMAGADGRPWLIDPSVLRRPPRGGPGDAAAVRGAVGSAMFDAYEEAAPLAEGWERARGALPAAAAARARAAVRRLLRGRPSASRSAMSAGAATRRCRPRVPLGTGGARCVPSGGGRSRRCARRHRLRAPPAVSAGAGGGRAPLPPAS